MIIHYTATAKLAGKRILKIRQRLPKLLARIVSCFFDSWITTTTPVTFQVYELNENNLEHITS